MGDAKNAIPGNKSVPADTVFAEIRFHTITMDKSLKSCIDTDAQRAAALTQHGDLTMISFLELVNQYVTRYCFSGATLRVSEAGIRSGLL